MRAMFFPALLVLSLASCSKPRPWPIPELSLPPGSSPAPIQETFLKELGATDLKKIKDRTNIFPSKYCRSWGKGFNSPLRWEDITEHVAGKLRPINYTPSLGKYTHMFPEIPDAIEREDYIRVWESPEGRYLVVVLNLKIFKALKVPGFEGADFIFGIDPIGMY